MKDALRDALARYAPQEIEHDGIAYLAAVLILIYEHEGRHYVVFQKRTNKVDAHKGEISFPGGGRDPEDADLIATALRETHEEIGAHPSDIEILGRLDDMVTRSNFLVTPYVGWLARYPYEWVFSADEVAYLLEVPIDHLQHPDTLIADRRMVNGTEFVMPSYQFGDELIWGATARMLTNFLDLLSAASG